MEFNHILFDRFLYLKSTGSTMQKAIDLIQSKEISGNFLIVAEEQTLGKGRGNSTWYSPHGGLWMTAALYNLHLDANITIFAGICLHKTLLALFPSLSAELTIKWPNDLFWDNRKIGGILCNYLEAHKYHLLGIGLNSNCQYLPENISTTASALNMILVHPVDNAIILDNLWDIFAADLPRLIDKGVDQDYFRNNSLLMNKKVLIDTEFQSFSGIVRGINHRGALLLEMKKGMIQPIYSGSVIDWQES